MFPEGRTGFTEGQLLPLKRGVAIYAMRAGVPIVPVGLIGTHDLWFRKKVTIRFGKPIIVPQNTRPKPNEVKVVIEELENQLYGLLPHDYHEPSGPRLFRNFINHIFW